MVYDHPFAAINISNENTMYENVIICIIRNPLLSLLPYINMNNTSDGKNTSRSTYGKLLIIRKNSERWRVYLIYEWKFSLGLTAAKSRIQEIKTLRSLTELFRIDREYNV